MVAMLRTRALPVLLVLVGVGVVSLWYSAGPQPADAGVSSTPAMPTCDAPSGLVQRREAQVATLRRETLEQSIAALGHWELYEVPGACFDECCAATLPLPPDAGRAQLSKILSNRRFLKVCEELDATPAAQAAELINACGPVWLEEYRVKYERYLERGRELCPPDLVEQGQRIVGWSHPSEDDLPPLQYMSLRLLALALIAGNLELAGTQPFVLLLAEEALAERTHLYQEGEFYRGFRTVTLDMHSLYNRQILGYALLKTSPDWTLAADGFAALGRGAQKAELTAFDAQRTRYDARLMPGAMDYSKGVLEVEFLPPITDQEFDTIVAAVLLAEQQLAEEEESQ